MSRKTYIRVSRRTSDYRAHVADNTARWEAGRTAAEAVAALRVSFPELVDAEVIEIDEHVYDRLQHVYDAQVDSFGGARVSHPNALLADDLIVMVSPACRSTSGITRGRYHPARYKLTARGLAYLNVEDPSK